MVEGDATNGIDLATGYISSPKDCADEPYSLLLALPTELLLHCLSYLTALDLTAVLATCRTLRKSASTDLLWQSQVNLNLPIPITSPKPLSTFRSLYIAHHAYWFLTRHKIWISDSIHYGKLMVARYDPGSGNIEGHAVVAERGPHTVSTWSENSSVLVHGFEPEVKLHLEQPVLKLGLDCLSTTSETPAQGRTLSNPFPTTDPTSPLAREVPMNCSHANGSPGFRSTFLLARDYPSERLSPGSVVWPPQSLPAPSRAHSSSSSDFTAISHKPTKHSEVSQATFRIRKWIEFQNRRASDQQGPLDITDRQYVVHGFRAIMRGLTPPSTERRGFNVNTFGTLDPAVYTPTPRKPYRGIYCGDYSGHGCEFLLVMQPDEGTEEPLPEGLNWLSEWLAGGRLQEENRNELTTRTFTRMNEILVDLATRDGFQQHVPLETDDPAADFDHEDEPDDDEEVVDEWQERVSTRGNIARQTTENVNGASDSSDIYSGRLVAIKLTGDPHVPRGEITFIAPDLGDKGLVRTAEEDIFRGARVVRSAGHIANRGFVYDEYIPSQLILVSHDRLAQYWQGFGHISFYRRVDLDALMAQT